MTNFELTNAICEEIRREYRVPSIPFSLEEGEPSLTGSKVGGIPYLPKGAKWPVDEKGAPLQFLAQIDCAQLTALPDHPHTGLLQFFIGADEMFGCDFGAMKTRNYAVIYHETVDSSVTAADIPLPELPQEDCSPLERGPFRILFGAPVEQGITPGDFRLTICLSRSGTSASRTSPLKGTGTSLSCWTRTMMRTICSATSAKTSPATSWAVIPTLPRLIPARSSTETWIPFCSSWTVTHGAGSSLSAGATAV